LAKGQYSNLSEWAKINNQLKVNDDLNNSILTIDKAFCQGTSYKKPLHCATKNLEIKTLL
jgi:hypothetical protein